MNKIEIPTHNSSAEALEEAKLHDATLNSVTMNWVNGEVNLTMTLLGGISAILIFQEVTVVVLPRQFPS
jgi:hypothetical protein